ncbi:Retrovirus-related Pol polyprotein from transposon 17.6 [Sparassis crispa]|uniref:Retrovirus-related Pol polyprotein from transposon 17.6 n=1 Tax=Sparassis crispa TaxID=139825 RepID=A0A401H2I0_9APHY|nr:Retrovirus-related Pol polyprotein from transposon 17.6 [Sparassis crispa]GBE88593.1 Retrovirus-related Pol polyprotein from transposon 17.6 [Sparassis crispa]
MLIDCGSPSVLIRDDLASTLHLHHFKLRKLFPLGDAWGAGEQVSHEWVKLRVSSADSSWTSITCQAIIVPSLCVPVLLGNLFLKFNHLIIDLEHPSIIDKRTNFDLLHPPSISPPSVLLPPRERRNATAEDSELIAHHQLALHRDIMCDLLLNTPPVPPITSSSISVIASICECVEDLAFLATLTHENADMKSRFADLFPLDIPNLEELPTNVYHHFRLKDPNLIITRCQYDCPKKYREAWKMLLQQHLDAGRMRPSSSPYASPSFLIPKADPTALPCWVNDYRVLNANIIPDVYPLPSIQEILSDCGKGTIWGKLNMTNSFFQTHIHPDDIPYTAVTTPFSLCEWTVMPQGCRNAPVSHQSRIFKALRPYIGSICHVYLDDIIIWSSLLDEH